MSFDDDIVEGIALVRTLKLNLMNPAAWQTPSINVQQQ
jgi:hypothetical protein